MEINGLPLHALVVHAAVVFGPLSALAGFAYAVPKWRDKVRWPLVATVGIALVAIWVAYLSGEQVEEGQHLRRPLAELLETHEDRAGILRISVTAFALVSFVAAWAAHQEARDPGLGRRWSRGRTRRADVRLHDPHGDAGAQIAWYGVNG